MKKTLTAMMAAILLGCGQEPPAPNVYSPKYNIGVATHKYNPNLDLMDAKYEATTQCLGYPEEKAYRKADTFVVEIMKKDDGKGFSCGSASPTGRCNGLYVPDTNTIKVLESLSGFGHELAHHLTGKGNNENNLVKTCGDGIDGMLNEAEWRTN